MKSAENQSPNLSTEVGTFSSLPRKAARKLPPPNRVFWDGSASNYVRLLGVLEASNLTYSLFAIIP